MRDLGRNPVRVAVVGLGRWGNTIAGVIERTPGFALATCYTRDPEKRDAFAARFKCGKESSYEALLARQDVEAVIITAPNNRHADLAVAAAASGKHAFVDKPIATTIPDARAMIAACREANVKLAIGASSRFLRGHRLCKKLVDDGTLGTVAMVECNYSNDRGLHYTPENWQWYKEGSPGGPLMQVAVHQLDNLYYLFGPVKRVSAEFRKILTRSEIPDVCVMWLEFDSGVLGTLGTSFVSPGSGSKHHAFFMNAYGDAANFYHDRWTGTQIFRRGVEVRERIAYEEFSGFDYLGEELKDFSDAIARDRRPEVDGEAGIQVLGVVLAAMRSSELGRPVALEEILNA
ncbi:MAG: Gfo/Idh/MocA family oxidoreductase [Burkholderiales bacterium]|nr:Gfo/Idh/MocA family oxidoreductase [Burkholderiales bacterium]